MVGLLCDLQSLNAVGPRSLPDHISILTLSCQPALSETSELFIGALPNTASYQSAPLSFAFKCILVDYCPHGNTVLPLEYQKLFSYKIGAVGIPYTRKLLFTMCQKEVEA